jgi:hypothetical protein
MIDSILAECRDLVARRLGALAHAWKDGHPGGRVIAAYPVWAPAEIPKRRRGTNGVPEESIR